MRYSNGFMPKRDGVRWGAKLGNVEQHKYKVDYCVSDLTRVASW